MSTTVPPRYKITSDTLEMKVANMTFMLERLAQDCAPLQFVRNLLMQSKVSRHSEESRVKSGGMSTGPATS